MTTRVFLTNPPLNMAETPLKYHKPLIPMGLAYLGAILENAFTGGRLEEYAASRLAGAPRGYRHSGRVAAQDNMFLSFYGLYDETALLRRMDAFFSASPFDEQYIGVSILSDGMRAARRLLKLFRRRFPKARLIVGGPHATFFPFDFYEDLSTRTGPLVDYVVRNEAERLITGIVAGDFADVAAGLSNASRYGVSVPTSDLSDPRCIVLDGGLFGIQSAGDVLDKLPFPAYFLFEDETGRLPYEPDTRYGLEDPAANINSSRGCPHKCTFCTIPKLVPGYRTLSPARIADIIAFLRAEYGVRSIFFREDNFMYGGGSIEGDRWPQIRELCERLQTIEGQIRWAIEARADNLMGASGVPGKSRLQLMQAAGLSGIYMGVESGSRTALRLYAKGASLDQMSHAIYAAHAAHVGVVATAVYSDQDIFHRSLYSGLGNAEEYELLAAPAREGVLAETRAFMDQHQVPATNREEYVMVGIPVSTVYQLLAGSMKQFANIVEHYDPASRYIYPRGYRWWSSRIYGKTAGVRAAIGYDFKTELEADPALQIEQSPSSRTAQPADLILSHGDGGGGGINGKAKDGYS